MKDQQTYVRFKLTDGDYKPTIAFGDGPEFLKQKAQSYQEEQTLSASCLET